MAINYLRACEKHEREMQGSFVITEKENRESGSDFNIPDRNRHEIQCK